MTSTTDSLTPDENTALANASSSPVPAVPKLWTRWQGALVVMAISLPMLLAYVIFKTGWAMPTDTVNKGDLLTPATSMVALQVTDSQGEELDWLAGKKLWRMVVVADNACDETCMQQLYTSRQVHKRLSDKSVRVERVFLNTAPSYSHELQAKLEAEYPRLKRYSVSSAQWSQAMAATSAAEQPLNGHHIYYIDQQGFAMMSYQPSHKGADLLDDIKRLLKYSYED